MSSKSSFPQPIPHKNSYKKIPHKNYVLFWTLLLPMTLTTKSVSRLPFCLLTVSLCKYWLRAKLGQEQQFWTGPLCSIILVLQWNMFSLDDTFVPLCMSFWLLGCHPMRKYWLNWKICYLGLCFYGVWLRKHTHILASAYYGN